MLVSERARSPTASSLEPTSRNGWLLCSGCGTSACRIQRPGVAFQRQWYAGGEAVRCSEGLNSNMLVISTTRQIRSTTRARLASAS